MKEWFRFKRVLQVMVSRLMYAHVIEKQPATKNTVRELGWICWESNPFGLLGADGIIRVESFMIKRTLVTETRASPPAHSTGNQKSAVQTIRTRRSKGKASTSVWQPRQTRCLNLS